MSAPNKEIIRPAAPEDYDAIVELWAASGLEVRSAGRDSRGAFVAQRTRFPATYLLAVIDGRIVGVILGTHDERKGWINRLAVHPEHRRQGLARRLIETCERALIREGIEIFAALVETHNSVSVGTFESAGYLRNIPVHYFHKRLRADV
ncbi:MAG: GNAT family N-acetyltransferase [Planctomycetes bacterium]|nr:GNAT family N-acetyltransferase [Planctomycetota bacterium]